MKSILRLSAIIILMLVFSFAPKSKETKVLVFSKTEGFRHKSIPAGIEAIKKLGAENEFTVDTTENADFFSEEKLKNYAAVIFLSTSGDVLNAAQQSQLKGFIRSGGGFVGIHAASTTETEWPWYGKLVGAYFVDHPKIQQATLHVVDHTHPSTKLLDSVWIRTDEWYNFKDINPNINVLITIDENSYEGGKNGKNHPISWYHNYDGGRSFYTALGHTNETYQEPKFLSHLLGGINYAIGLNE